MTPGVPSDADPLDLKHLTEDAAEHFLHSRPRREIAFVGLNSGFLIGLMTGLFSFIPFVGALTGFLIAAIVAVAQFWPEWMPMADAIARLREFPAPVGGHPVEALVRCPSPRDQNPAYRQIFRALDITLRKRHVGGCDVYFTTRAAYKASLTAVP